MKRMLISSAVALALVATMGVHEAMAAKGKEGRANGQPLRVKVRATNVTQGTIERHNTASAGDEVCIELKIDNRSGESQLASIHVTGGIPGCPVDETVLEFMDAGATATAEVCGIVPVGESGTLVYDVDVLLTKSGDTQSDNGSVAFNLSAKSEAPASGGLFHRIFARMMLRSLLQLNSGKGVVDADMTELKSLYR